MTKGTLSPNVLGRAPFAVLGRASPTLPLHCKKMPLAPLDAYKELSRLADLAAGWVPVRPQGTPHQMPTACMLLPDMTCRLCTMMSKHDSPSSGLQVRPPPCRMQLTVQQAPGLPTTWLRALQMLRCMVAQPWTVCPMLRHPQSSSRGLGPHLSGVDCHACWCQIAPSMATELGQQAQAQRRGTAGQLSTFSPLSWDKLHHCVRHLIQAQDRRC